jgi:hypothetical protein
VDRCLGGIALETGDPVAVVGDTNGDGFDDAVTSLMTPAGYSWQESAAALMLGGTYSSVKTGDALIKGEYSDRGNLFGHDLDGAGDLNADGYADIVIGAPWAHQGSFETGAAFVFLGPISGEHSMDEANAVLLGEEHQDQAGWSVAGLGDTDGDGTSDLAVGAPMGDGNGSQPGVVYVVRGPVAGTVDLAAADLRVVGEEDADETGATVAAAGDVDGDGLQDLLVGAPRNDRGGFNSGAAWLLTGAQMWEAR